MAMSMVQMDSGHKKREGKERGSREERNPAYDMQYLFSGAVYNFENPSGKRREE